MSAMNDRFERPKMNRMARPPMVLLFSFSIALMCLMTLVSLTIGGPWWPMLCASITALLIYVRSITGIVAIKCVGVDYVLLSDGQNDVELRKENTAYVLQWTRYPGGEYFLLLAKVKTRIGRKKYYLFVNDPKYGVMNVFRRMGIPLKNTPE